MTPLLLSLFAVAGMAIAAWSLHKDSQASSHRRSNQEICEYMYSGFIWWRIAVFAAGSSVMFYVWSVIVLFQTLSPSRPYQVLGLFLSPLLGLVAGEILKRRKNRPVTD